jgi:hypothetical protein
MAKMNFNIDLKSIKVSDLLKVFQVFKGLQGLRVLSVLIWPGIIILVCCGILTTAWLMGKSLKQRAGKESMPMSNKIQGMLKTSPASGQIEVERRYQEAYQQDVNLIKQLSIQSTERELLSYDIFPQPKDTSTLLFTRFGTKYCQAIDSLLAKVNARDCPSTEELTAAQQAIGGAGSSRLPGGAARIIDEICQARAKSASVYANPQSACGYDFWQGYQYANMDDSIKDCWYWQLGYWVIEDVFTTIEKINAGSNNVFSSPVKRLVRVGFVTPDALVLGGEAGKATQDKPKYVVKPEDQLTESFTGRLSNDDIDVIHFSAVLVMSTKAIIPFMQELCSAKEHKFMGFTGQEPAKVFKHNQITVLESRVRPVDMTLKSNRDYRYGSDSVVQVEIVCEYIFNKKGYDAIKPEQVKNTAPKTGS